MIPYLVSGYGVLRERPGTMTEIEIGIYTGCVAGSSPAIGLVRRDHSSNRINTRIYRHSDKKKKNMRYLMVILLLLAALITTGCVSGPQNVGVVTTQPTSLPASAPPIIQAPSGQDPIVGTWQNGMVFYANGTFGNDGTTSWRENRDEKNAYFIISDKPSELDRARNVTSTEWIYIPASDCIHKRGSSVLVYRNKG
jgi:hypothetical protein